MASPDHPADHVDVKLVIEDYAQARSTQGPVYYYGLISNLGTESVTARMMGVYFPEFHTILGTYRQPKHVPKGYPIFKIHSGPDHSVHELDLPKEFEQITSADELHRRLGDHLKRTAPHRE